VRKADAEKRRAMSARQAIARGVVTRIAAQRYEQQWVDHVLSLPNKAAMHRAVACGGYGKFLKRAKSKEWKKWLEGEARSRFHASPEDCLLQLGIVDVEVNESIAEADDAASAADLSWISIDKKRLPFL
jgi:hypothetical protein